MRQFALLALLAPLTAPAFAGDRRFEMPVAIDSGAGAVGFVAADFDGDGTVDFATATDPGVWFIRGLGHLEFAAPVPLTTGRERSSLSVCAGDFDDDGRLDIAAALNEAERVAVHLNDGAGGFSPAALYSLGISRKPYSIEAADLNHDGYLDLVTANYYGADGSVLLGDGTGEFALVGHFLAGYRSSEVVVADMDGDTHPDLVFSNYFGARIRYGDGTGIFLGDLFLEAGLLEGFRHVTVLDYDADSLPDVVVSSPLDNALYFFSNGGDRSFDPPQERAGDSHRHLKTADFNRDGRADVAVGGYSVRIIDGAAPLDAYQPRFGGTHQAGYLLPGDFDVDGFMDIAVADRMHSRIRLFLGDGTGAFGAPRSYLAPVPTLQPHQVLEIGDFDSDGRPDVVSAGGTDVVPDGIVVAKGDGRGNLVDPTILRFSGWEAFAAGDFDADGDDDVLVVEERSVTLVRGDGAGGFGERVVSSAPGPYSDDFVATADFDHDLAIDVAIPSSSALSIDILRNDGLGGFVPADTLSVSSAPRAIAAGDFDGDGDMDIAAPLTEADVVAVFHGLGDGSFSAQFDFSVPECPSRIAADDFDRDGIDDLAILSDNRFGIHRGALALLLADGSGGFFPFRLVSRLDSIQQTGVSAIDVDEDGLSDLVVALRESAGLFLGLGDGNFVPCTEVPLFRTIRAARGADFDDDGRLDLAFPSEFGGIQATLICLDRTNYLPDAMRGNVGGMTGPPENVLFVNGSPGTGDDRLVEIGMFDPLDIRLATASSRPSGPTKFVLYKWLVSPSASTVVDVPFGLGRMAAAPPLVPAGLPQFKQCWNTIGKFPELGIPTHAAAFAPTVIQSNPAGLRRPVTWLLQGFIADRAAPNGRAATTNGIHLRVR